MRVLSSVIGTTFFASVLGVCNQCPLPALNASAFAPCLQQVVGQGCCAVGRPMVNNPCVKVWLANPLLAPFAGVIEKARVACNVNAMAACTPAVAAACPTECSVPSTASAQTAGNRSVGANQMNGMMMNPNMQNSSMMMQNSSMMMQNSSMMMRNSSMMMQNSSMMMQNSSMMMMPGMMQNSSMMMMNSTMMNATMMNATYLVQNTTCPANEEYTSCASSSCWEHNCTNNTLVVPGPFCTLICRQGCKCQKGFARNPQTGRCVNETQCGNGRSAVTVAPTPVCPQNETYTTCSSTSCFEHTCMNNTLMIPGPICNLACRSGCKCQMGFARNAASGGCIPESQCSTMSMMMNVTCQVRAAADQAACGRRIGCAITQCNPDGTYASRQCSGSTGYCWCVDSNGNEIANSRQGPGQGAVNCASSVVPGKAPVGKAKGKQTRGKKTKANSGRRL